MAAASGQGGVVVAYFDFDGTLTKSDSLLPFLRFSKGNFGLAASAMSALPMLLAYLLRVVSNEVGKERLLSACYRGLGSEAFGTLAQRFAGEKIQPLLRPEGLERLAWHRAQGHLCVLVSASLEAYLEPWARTQGFHAVLASRLEVHQGRLTGRFHGRNCYGSEKVERISRWEQGRAVTRRYAYGDSVGDDAMLRYVQRPFRWSKGHRAFTPYLPKQ